MPRLRCPRCSTVLDAAPGMAPVCPSCGFGSSPAHPAPSQAPPADAPAAPAAPPTAAPAPAAPLAGKGRILAIAMVSILVLSVAAAGVVVFLMKDGSPGALSEAEARQRVAASLLAAGGVFQGKAPSDDLAKVDASMTPPSGASGSPMGLNIGNIHMVMEWGQDGALQMRLDAANGPVTLAFAMTCTKDRRAMEYSGQAFVSRPYVDGAPDCTDFGDGEGASLEEGAAPSLDDFDAAGAQLTIHDDGSIHAVMARNGTTVDLDIDAQGRLTTLTAASPTQGSWTMAYQYGGRRALTVPANAKLMPAEVESTPSTMGDKETWTVASSPQEPPLSEMQVRIQPYGYGYGGTGGNASGGQVLSFPADVAGPQVQGNYTVQYNDADHDGKVSAGDSWDVVDAGAASGDNPFGFSDHQVVLYDEVAKGEANGSPLGAPGLGWLPLAGLALGLALLRRR